VSRKDEQAAQLQHSRELRSPFVPVLQGQVTE
jgi:hypothetical protein